MRANNSLVLKFDCFYPFLADSPTLPSIYFYYTRVKNPVKGQDRHLSTDPAGTAADVRCAVCKAVLS